MRISNITAEVYGTRKRLKIILSFIDIKGTLGFSGKTAGLILEIDNIPAFSISSVKAIQGALHIYTTAGYNAINGIDGCSLKYQPTINDYIYDTLGTILEELPPFPIYDSCVYSPYCHCGYITEIFPLNKQWEMINTSDIPNDDAFSPFVCNHNIISPRVLNKHRKYDYNSIVYIRFCFETYTDLDIDLLWGCSGKLKVSIDKKQMQNHYSPTLLFASLVQSVHWKKGKHTIDVAFSNTLTNRGDKGVSLKIRSKDPEGELPVLLRDDNANYFFNI